MERLKKGGDTSTFGGPSSGNRLQKESEWRNYKLEKTNEGGPNLRCPRSGLFQEVKKDRRKRGVLTCWKAADKEKNQSNCVCKE